MLERTGVWRVGPGPGGSGLCPGSEWATPQVWTDATPPDLGRRDGFTGNARGVGVGLLRVEGHEEVVQRLGQGGVRDHRIPKSGVGEVPHHRHVEHGRDLPALDAQDRRSQDLI